MRHAREVGGITLAQCAIDSGYIEFVLSPGDIAREIVHVARAEE